MESLINGYFGRNYVHSTVLNLGPEITFNFLLEL